jgi:hypothetical protein
MRFFDVVAPLILATVVACSGRTALDGDSSVSLDAKADAEGSLDAHDRHDAAADDAAREDANVSEDSNRDVRGEESARTPGAYEQWFYPQCETADGSCPTDTCVPAMLNVAPTSCGPWSRVAVGCKPLSLLMSGAVCLVRISDGEVITTDNYPYTEEGLETCTAAGVGDVFQPYCPADGGQN